jgi:HPt (histidine-containing phosphotransfer) domain-containing protein
MTHESTRQEHLPDEPVDRAAYAALLESVRGDAAFVAELIEVFAMDAARLLASMRSAAEDGRAEEVARAMHQLKSSSASLGATLLPQLCSELETEARTGTSQGLEGQVPIIEAEVSRVTVMLRALCATP